MTKSIKNEPALCVDDSQRAVTKHGKQSTKNREKTVRTSNGLKTKSVSAKAAQRDPEEALSERKRPAHSAPPVMEEKRTIRIQKREPSLSDDEPTSPRHPPAAALKDARY